MVVDRMSGPVLIWILISISILEEAEEEGILGAHISY